MQHSTLRVGGVESNRDKATNNWSEHLPAVQLHWLDSTSQLPLNLCPKSATQPPPINQKICLIVISTPSFSWLPDNYWAAADTIRSNQNILNDCICSFDYTVRVQATMLPRQFFSPIPKLQDQQKKIHFRKECNLQKHLDFLRFSLLAHPVVIINLNFQISVAKKKSFPFWAD